MNKVSTDHTYIILSGKKKCDVRAESVAISPSIPPFIVCISISCLYLTIEKWYM